jgi:rhodanese-related sulfurtransferase
MDASSIPPSVALSLPPPQGITLDAFAIWHAKPIRPLIVDVRREPAFAADPQIIPSAIRRAPESVLSWARGLDPARTIVVYCVHGHQVSQQVAATLAALGHDAQYLEDGLAGWQNRGLSVRPWSPPSRWVTRARPKIDRIACPWLIRRFIDPDAQFFYVPADQVMDFSASQNAIAYDVPGVQFTHRGERCSFDALIEDHGLTDPALLQLAQIVRGADTGALDLAAQADGLLALSLGLSRLIGDDLKMLQQGLAIYDALYAWCSQGQSETHGWHPERLAAEMQVAPAVKGAAA